MNSKPLLNGLRVTLPFSAITRLVRSMSSVSGGKWEELLNLLERGDHDAITRLSLDPDCYTDPKALLLDYQAVSLLRKADFLKTSFNCTQVAMEKFHQYEDKCRETNHRIYSSDPTGRVGDVLVAARGKIRSLIGDAPSRFDYEAIGALAQWGPGVTSSVKGAEVSLFHKLAGKLQATPDLHRVGVGVLLSTIPTWQAFHSESDVEVIRGNTLCTVPKDAKTDRTIAVEPHLNAFFQRGVGKLLAKYLRKWGVDLRDQTRNQRLAHEGSLNGSISTIDLSGASDCISKALVEWIMPPSWVALLRCLRSPEYQLDKEWRRYEKWSSMGNGYTFELESLIFYSIAWAATTLSGADTSRVSCYGDDIIVPMQSASITIEALNWAGFAVNEDKTYTSPFTFFRESCGKDYLLGVDVRPIFLKKMCHITHLYGLANNLLEVAEKEPLFYRLRERVIQLVPERFHYFVPKGLSDGGFHMAVGELFSRQTGINLSPRGPFRELETKHLVFVPSGVPRPDNLCGLGWALAKPGEPSVSEVLHGIRQPSDNPKLGELRGEGRWCRRRLRFAQGTVV